MESKTDAAVINDDMIRSNPAYYETVFINNRSADDGREPAATFETKVVTKSCGSEPRARRTRGLA